MAGQLIPRGKNVWLVRVFLGRDPDTGKRLYHNETMHGTKKDAETLLNKTLRDRDMGSLTIGSQKRTVGLLLDDLLRDYRINGKSIQWAEIVVEIHLRPFFGESPIGKVTSTMVDKYIESRQTKGRANGTINRELALLRRAFNLGREATPPKVTVVPRIRELEENNVRKGFFEHDAFVAVRRMLPEEIRPVVTFAYFTGCRRGEVLKLEWHQVDLAEGIIRLDPGTTKNDEARIIALVDELWEMLRLQKQARDLHYPTCAWVFSREGKRIKTFRGAWEAACKAAGLLDAAGKPLKLFHDFRRTGVRNLVRAGVSENVARAISGHKTRDVFDRYNIVSEADLKDAARRLGRYVSEKEAPRAEQPAESRHTIGTQKPPEKIR